MPVEFAGETVEAGQIGQLAHILVALVDDADEAVRARRLAVDAGEPTTSILDPELGFATALGTDAILNLVGDAAAVVALGGIDDDVEARLGVLGLEELRIGAAGGNRRPIGDQQHLAGVIAPRQRIAVDAPIVSDFADRTEDRRRVGCAGTDRVVLTAGGHGRLSSECAVRGWRQQTAVAPPSYRQTLNNSENRIRRSAVQTAPHGSIGAIAR